MGTHSRVAGHRRHGALLENLYRQRCAQLRQLRNGISDEPADIFRTEDDWHFPNGDAMRADAVNDDTELREPQPPVPPPAPLRSRTTPQPEEPRGPAEQARLHSSSCFICS
jgi:hypothetical protein